MQEVALSPQLKAGCMPLDLQLHLLQVCIGHCHSFRWILPQLQDCLAACGHSIITSPGLRPDDLSGVNNVVSMTVLIARRVGSQTE